jgi:hypothetical protein
MTSHCGGGPHETAVKRLEFRLRFAVCEIRLRRTLTEAESRKTRSTVEEFQSGAPVGCEKALIRTLYIFGAVNCWNLFPLWSNAADQTRDEGTRRSKSPQDAP